MTSRLTPTRTLAAALSLAAGASAQTFTPLGYFNPTNATITGSMATGISADGSIVVGGSYLYDPDLATTVMHGFRWTAAGGMTDLGKISLSSSIASRTSNDGNTIGGNSGFISFGNQVEPRNAGYWTTAATAPVAHLVSTSPPIGYITTDVSAAGSVIVGQTRPPGFSPVPDRAFMFTESGGIQLIDLPAGHTTPASANAISADGSVIVGYSEAPDALKAWRWTSAGGVQVLPNIPTGTPAGAYGVSANGQVIVGDYDNQAMRWTAAGGFQLLGPAGVTSIARDASADGSVIVGNAFFTGDPQNPTAFIWDAAHGMRDLRQTLLFEFGLGQLIYWNFTDAVGVSDDGLTITGQGTDQFGLPEAWLVHLTSLSPPCYANCDHSTAAPILNVADFTCFLQNFAQAAPYANCDGSTTPPTLNVADFTCYLQKFAAGCP